MCRVSRNLGGPDAPPATRATTPGWRDPRLWIGIAIVAVSVVAGARLLGRRRRLGRRSGRSTSDMGAGDAVTADDLVVAAGALRRGRRTSTPTSAADDELPADLQLRRGVGAGELLPRAAVGPAAESDTMQLPVAVDTALVPPSVRSGSVVDVYLTGSRRRGRRGAAGPRRGARPCSTGSP